ncbi:hypothetical protein Y032_0136g1971 [Ancylostoma ceylanicum]|uniref:CNNM transmembrane domain-containing protein n=2 Tax=Ancylostoma ceylanicum TaxID=53326 RepID=A0A016T5G3_9BILA|nr:hypothetical protein Y032_0136g1971 [Ancylostoma ceylanicum]
MQEFLDVAISPPLRIVSTEPGEHRKAGVPMSSFCHVTLTLLAVILAYTTADDDPGWETLQVVPHVSGLRVESISKNGFIGYTWETFILIKSSEAQELIVEPNVKVTVVVFGYFLDKVEYITFTDSICLTSEFNISRQDFTIQTETKIELKMSFPNGEDSWRMCVKQQGRLGELLLIDDDRTWINTEEKPRNLYMPIYVQIGVLAVLLTMSALFSGLNLGLMSLSTHELNLIIKSGSKKEAKYAQTILPVRKRGNYLLCSILIMNVVVNSAVSILFEDVLSGTVAFVAASFGILVLGEITPQSICVKHGLAVGARTIFLTRFFMFITAPLSYPISKVLDLILGEEVDQFDRRRLVEILKMSTEKEENVDLAADVKIAVGAMEFTTKVAKDVMTKIDDVFMLSENEILDATTLAEIVHRGYTRIPVFVDGDRNKVKSLLLVKDLALIDKKNNIPVKAVAEFNERQLRIINEDMPLPKLLDEFKEGNYHLAMVRQLKRKNTSTGSESVEQFSEEGTLSGSRVSVNTIASFPCGSNADSEDVTLIGLVTLEDLLEEILQSEIIDESDSVLDNVNRSRRKTHQTRVSEVFCCEARSEPLSLNMLGVVSRWLAERHVFFSDKHMEIRAREKLIQKNIRHVILVSEQEDRSVPLYEAGVASKRFILILEGKATVIFPKSNMSFEVGPWTCFGEILFQRLSASIRSRQDTQSNMHFTPDFRLVAQQPCRFLQVPIMAVVHALRISRFVKQLRAPKVSTSDEDDPVPVLLGGRGRGADKLAHKHSVTLKSTIPHDGRARSLSMVSATLHLSPSLRTTKSTKKSQI